MKKLGTVPGLERSFAKKFLWKRVIVTFEIRKLHRVDLARISTCRQTGLPDGKRGTRDSAMFTLLDISVDLRGIEPLPPQCECGVLPLNYRPVLSNRARAA